MNEIDEMETRINEVLEELTDSVLNSIEQDTDRTIDAVERVRKDIANTLTEYSDEKDVVRRNRLRKLLRELDSVEDDLYSELDQQLEKRIDSVIDTTTSQLTKALTTIIGATLLVKAGNAIGDDIRDEIHKVMYEREFSGMTLERRLRTLAGSLRGTIQEAIRYGVNVGETITKIALRIKREVERVYWTIARIIKSELPTALRVSVAIIGSKSGVVKAVKIIDNRGRHANHKRHECYRLAEQNKYGMGKGVYLPTDTFIFDPHPQCSAYYRYILDRSKLEGGD